MYENVCWFYMAQSRFSEGSVVPFLVNLRFHKSIEFLDELRNRFPLWTLLCNISGLWCLLCGSCVAVDTYVHRINILVIEIMQTYKDYIWTTC